MHLYPCKSMNGTLKRTSKWGRSSKQRRRDTLVSQDTLWHVGRLFLSQHGPDHEALLPGMVQEDGMSGEPELFGPLPGADSPAASEAEAWKVPCPFSNPTHAQRWARQSPMPESAFCLSL